MASILVTLASSPETSTGRHALALAESLVHDGHALTLCCVQDAALLASTRAPRQARAAFERLLERGARCLVLNQDLALRGLTPEPHACPVNYAEMIAALTSGHARVIGAL